MDEKLKQEIKKRLDSSHGEMHLFVDKGVTHIDGNMNDMGTMVSIYSLIKFIQSQGDLDFEEVIVMLKTMDDIMSSEVVERNRQRNCK